VGGGGACEEEELPSKQTDSKSQTCHNSNKNPSTRIPSKQGVCGLAIYIKKY
jgi:hypothetical protein